MSPERPGEPIVLDLGDGTTFTVHRSADGRVRLDLAGPQEGSDGEGGESGPDGEGRDGARAEPLVLRGRKAMGLSARRVRPGLWTPIDVALVFGCAASSALVVAVLLHSLTSSPGWVADLALWYLLSLVMIFFCTLEQLGRLAAVDRVATLLIGTGALLLLVPLASLLGYVLARGLPHLRISFFLHDLNAVTPDAPPERGGGLHAIIGTLEQAGLALCLVMPLGLLTAVFLNETRSPLRRPVRIVVDAMSGLPSIVAGLFIYSSLIVHKPLPIPLFGFNGLMAALALSLVMLPTVTRTTEVVLRLVPDGLREASLALGASRARTVWSVVLPTARSGVTTAVVLGLARVVGETAPLLFTSFGTTLINTDPFNGPQESLPLYVFKLVKSPSRSESDRGYAGAVVLILVVLTLFYLARILGRQRTSRSRADRSRGSRSRASQPRSGPAGARESR